MALENVQFTGLEVNRKNLLTYRMSEGPFPASWSRLIVKNELLREITFLHWIMENTYGRFGTIWANPKALVYFEDHKDAILFKLMDAEEAILSKEYTR